MRGEGELLRDRKGAYFFVIDAFIAAAILSLTLVLIFNLFVSPTRTEQSFSFAHDLISFLTQTEVRDYRHSDITDMISKGHINDIRNTLSEEILIFFDKNDFGNASIILNASTQSLPQTLAINVSIFDPATSTSTPLYERKEGSGLSKRSHLTARSVEYALDEQNQIIGPYVLRVEVWS